MVACAAATGLLRAEVNGLLDLSRFCLYLDRRLCLQFAEQALVKSEGLDDAVSKALLKGNAANLNLMLRGWRAEDADACRQAVKVIGETQDLSVLMRLYSMEVVLKFLSSDYRGCCAATKRGRELALTVGDWYLFSLYNTTEAFSFLYLGQWGEVQRKVSAALTIAVRNVNAQAIALGRLTIGWLHAEAQDFAGAAKCGEETLNAAIEANPFNFFIGRNLLAKAYVGLRKWPSARVHLDEIDRKVEREGVEMDSSVTPHYYVNRCEYWLAVGDLDRAQDSAARLQELSALAPERTFLALSHGLLATVAMARGHVREARDRISRAIATVRNAESPLAAWRIYATAANLHDSVGELRKAVICRRRSEQVLRSLANTLEQDDPLRWSLLGSRADMRM
jgi:hypothetical protein